VKRHRDADIEAKLTERARQRAGYVAEAADLGERAHLGGREENVQADSPRERCVGDGYVYRMVARPATVILTSVVLPH
jgi:hypothetical protein